MCCPACLNVEHIQGDGQFKSNQITSPGAACAPSRRCLVEGTVTTLAGRTPKLVSLEPGREAERSLVSKPQTHGEAETGFAEHDLPSPDNGVMS